MKEINEILSTYESVSLKEIDRVKFMKRTDTKFVFPIQKLSKILKDAKPFYYILEIDNKRSLKYETTYFDTDDFSMYIAHQNGKLNRYKIRSRKYINTQDSFLEIKFKSNKNKTIKKRIKTNDFFSEASRDFIKKNSPYSLNELKARVETKFSRITLVSNKFDERLTIDFNLSFENNKKIDKLPFLSIAEVKQEKFSSSSEFIKILKNYGIRQMSLSKYCTGINLLYKNLKQNRFKPRLLTLKKLSNDS
ncbi:MAG: polyphosphate polymerase domain-containing protein [Bacteroidetes bacterium]|nr:polyphosphate polymerase domain-containing protein [Bacteroidota bacterium]